jgi:hypothetical protein
MAITLTELEERLQALEAQMASLRELVRGSAPRESEARRPGESGASPTEAEHSLAVVYQQMGIGGEAPGIEQLRALLAAQGVHPGDEVIRQEIAGMRQQETDE